MKETISQRIIGLLISTVIAILLLGYLPINNYISIIVLVYILFIIFFKTKIEKKTGNDTKFSMDDKTVGIYIVILLIIYIADILFGIFYLTIHFSFFIYPIEISELIILTLICYFSYLQINSYLNAKKKL